MWTPDDLLTPSFKLKRADAKKKCGGRSGEGMSMRQTRLTPLLLDRYLSIIDALYIALGDSVGGKHMLR